MDLDLKKKVIDANIAVHTRMADDYNTGEPHFRPENLKAVEGKLLKVAEKTGAGKLLDLGCGTGFMIQIAKAHFKEIVGVDVTPAMLAKVDKTGPCAITLMESDAGDLEVADGTFDMVTSYAFLHHLYDVPSVMRSAARALKPGGVYYADLDPNWYFWDGVSQLDREGEYDPIVKREIEAVSYKDEEIQEQFGVDCEVFNHAEYSKAIGGGFREEVLQEQLLAAGFSKVEVFYNWFIGQGALINDQRYGVEERFTYAAVMDEWLQRALPVSRNLYKYLGFYATK